MKAWKHRWFGFWREFGKSYENCPSWNEFSVTAYESKAILAELDYLKSGTRVCVRCIHFDVDTRQSSEASRSLELLTDGVWLWPTNLVQFITEYGVCLPEEFKAHMASRNYQCAEVKNIDPRALPWPWSE
jgi:hypothetical protein